MTYQQPIFDQGDMADFEEIGSSLTFAGNQEGMFPPSLDHPHVAGAGLGQVADYPVNSPSTQPDFFTPQGYQHVGQLLYYFDPDTGIILTDLDGFPPLDDGGGSLHIGAPPNVPYDHHNGPHVPPAAMDAIQADPAPGQVNSSTSSPRHAPSRLVAAPVAVLPTSTSDDQKSYDEEEGLFDFDEYNFLETEAVGKSIVDDAMSFSETTNRIFNIPVEQQVILNDFNSDMDVDGDTNDRDKEDVDAPGIEGNRHLDDSISLNQTQPTLPVNIGPVTSSPLNDGYFNMNTGVGQSMTFRDPRLQRRVDQYTNPFGPSRAHNAGQDNYGSASEHARSSPHEGATESSGYDAFPPYTSSDRDITADPPDLWRSPGPSSQSTIGMTTPSTSSSVKDDTRGRRPCPERSTSQSSSTSGSYPSISTPRSPHGNNSRASSKSPAPDLSHSAGSSTGISVGRSLAPLRMSLVTSAPSRLKAGKRSSRPRRNLDEDSYPDNSVPKSVVLGSIATCGLGAAFGTTTSGPGPPSMHPLLQQWDGRDIPRGQPEQSRAPSMTGGCEALNPEHGGTAFTGIFQPSLILRLPGEGPGMTLCGLNISPTLPPDQTTDDGHLYHDESQSDQAKSCHQPDIADSPFAAGAVHATHAMDVDQTSGKGKGKELPSDNAAGPAQRTPIHHRTPRSEGVSAEQGKQPKGKVPKSQLGDPIKAKKEEIKTSVAPDYQIQVDRFGLLLEYRPDHETLLADGLAKFPTFVMKTSHRHFHFFRKLLERIAALESKLKETANALRTQSEEAAGGPVSARNASAGQEGGTDCAADIGLSEDLLHLQVIGDPQGAQSHGPDQATADTANQAENSGLPAIVLVPQDAPDLVCKGLAEAHLDNDKEIRPLLEEWSVLKERILLPAVDEAREKYGGLPWPKKKDGTSSMTDKELLGWAYPDVDDLFADELDRLYSAAESETVKLEAEWGKKKVEEIKKTLKAKRWPKYEFTKLEDLWGKELVDKLKVAIEAKNSVAVLASSSLELELEWGKEMVKRFKQAVKAKRWKAYLFPAELEPGIDYPADNASKDEYDKWVDELPITKVLYFGLLRCRHFRKPHIDL